MKSGTPKSTAMTPVFQGLRAKNFKKICENGFGDRHNAYPHSMTVFKDHLYVGTTRSNLHMRGIGQNPERVGKAWPVKLPDEIWDLDLRAQIWRYNFLSSTWRKVFTSPMVMGNDGFEVPRSVGFRSMTPFQGRSDSAPALYVPTWATHQRPETVLLRSEDGLSFEVVSEPGLGLTKDPPRVLRGLVPFKGRLFTSPAMGPKRREPNSAGVMLILCSDDPRNGKWELACEPRFGNPNNISVFQMEVFNGFLYACTMNINEGFQVWKTDGEGKAPFHWQRVLTHGAYRGQLNQIAMTVKAFGDHLYIGSAIQHGGYDRNNKIGPAPPEILRLNRDDSWDIVVGDARITDEGLKVPISGIPAGFGNFYGGYLWSMCVHQGWLYVGNAVWSAFLKYVDRQKWPERLQRIYTPKRVERILKENGGCDIWRTRDGHRWVPVTQNGFDNQYNIGVRNMVSTPYGMFVGTANSFGPESAEEKAAGWQYEDNPKGGLEIWQGMLPESDSLQESRSGQQHSTRGITPKPVKTDNEETIYKRLLEEFWEGSDLQNFGFWNDRIVTPGEACQNLFDEMLAFWPKKEETIVDIGCGLGASTYWLTKYYYSTKIKGITTSNNLLAACRQKGTDVQFVKSSLPRIALANSSAQSALWCKGYHPIGNRKKLVHEAARILEPNGILVCFDVIYKPAKKKILQLDLFSREQRIVSCEEYEKILSRAGFCDIEIVDVTYQSIYSFQKFYASFLDIKKYSGEIDDAMYLALEERLFPGRDSIEKGIIISARKRP